MYIADYFFSLQVKDDEIKYFANTIIMYAVKEKN